MMSHWRQRPPRAAGAPLGVPPPAGAGLSARAEARRGALAAVTCAGDRSARGAALDPSPFCLSETQTP